MNPWTIDEMLKARVLYPDQSDDEVIETFGNAGPSARLCLQFTSAELEDFYENRRGTISMITVPEFERLIWDGKGLMMYDVSHKITTVRRESADEMRTHVVEPVSERVRCQLRRRFQEWAETERIGLLKRFSRIPGARGMTGVLFEAHFQDHFAKEITLDARAMFRTGNARSRWHPVFGNFLSNPKLLEAQNNELQKKNAEILLNIRPRSTIVFEKYNDEKIQVKKNTYYIPEDGSFPAIDSFIVDRENLYLFQFTNGGEHGIESGFEKLLEKRFSGLPASKNWYFLFVVPKNLSEFTCFHSNDGFLADHVPYIAQVSIGN